MEKQLAVCISNDNKTVTAKQTIDAAKKAGFKSVFLQWYDKDFEIPQQQQAQLCKEAGLNIIFAHLGYQKINELWIKGKTGDAMVERYCRNLEEMASLGIPMVVMHLSSKFDAPSPNEIGMTRLRTIIAKAEELKIKIAFENTKALSHLFYVMKQIDSPYVGVCFDAGHWHCNNKENWNLDEFKDRIFGVHLHDNDGSDDQHLLPFDGTMNWPKVLKMLKEANYQGPLTMELCYRHDYLKESVETFYEEAIKRGEALKTLL